MYVRYCSRSASICTPRRLRTVQPRLIEVGLGKYMVEARKDGRPHQTHDRVGIFWEGIGSNFDEPSAVSCRVQAALLQSGWAFVRPRGKRPISLPQEQFASLRATPHHTPLPSLPSHQMRQWKEGGEG